MLDPTLRESLHSYWLYHYSKNGKALCGANTMPTSAPIALWGYRGHLHERYCSMCEALAAKEKNDH